MSAANRFDDWFDRRSPKAQWVVAAVIVWGGSTAIFSIVLYAIYFAADWVVGLPPGTSLYPVLLAAFMSSIPVIAERDRLTDHDFADIWRPLPRLFAEWQTPRGLPRLGEMTVRMIIGLVPAFATLAVIQAYSGAVGMSPEVALRTVGFAAIFLYWIGKLIPSSEDEGDDDG